LPPAAGGDEEGCSIGEKTAAELSSDRAEPWRLPPSLPGAAPAAALK
jgi:hypothetical protein